MSIEKLNEIVNSKIENLKYIHEKYVEAEKIFDEARPRIEDEIWTLIENEWSKQFPGTELSDGWLDRRTSDFGSFSAGCKGPGWIPELYSQYQYVKKDGEDYRATTGGWEYWEEESDCPSYSELIPGTEISIEKFEEFFHQLSAGLDIVFEEYILEPIFNIDETIIILDHLPKNTQEENS